jgi:hypothetical protein
MAYKMYSLRPRGRACERVKSQICNPINDSSMIALLVLAGLWNVADGVGSLIYFRSQTWPQLGRVVRVLVGVAVMWYGLM